MALKTQDQLLSELSTRVRSGGSGGKTTAQDLHDFLASLTAELFARDALPGGVDLAHERIVNGQSDFTAASFGQLNRLAGGLELTMPDPPAAGTHLGLRVPPAATSSTRINSPAYHLDGQDYVILAPGESRFYRFDPDRGYETLLSHQPSNAPASQVELHLEFEPLSAGFTQVSKDIFVTAPKAGTYTAATFENVSQVQITDQETSTSETRLANAAWAPLALVAGRSYRFLITPTASNQGGALILTT